MAQCFSIQIGQGFPSMAALPLADPNNRFLVNFLYISTSFLRPRMVRWKWCGKILSYLSNFIPFPQYQSISININQYDISCKEKTGVFSISDRIMYDHVGSHLWYFWCIGKGSVQPRHSGFAEAGTGSSASCAVRVFCLETCQKCRVVYVVYVVYGIWSLIWSYLSKAFFCVIWII